MRAIKLSRKTHKWVAIIVGIQMLLWAASGFYMVVVNIDIIHGDMLVKNTQQSIGENTASHTSLDQLISRYPGAQSITLKAMMDRPVYLIQEDDTTLLLDAVSGKQLSPLDKETASQIAHYHYAGEGTIQRVELIEKNPPSELQSRSLPLWRIDFDDIWNSSFYIVPNTGQFVTRRHTLWRVFDFMWMLHIMDYDERSDMNNTLLRIFSSLGVLFGLSGLWLLFYSFNRRRLVDLPMQEDAK